MPGIITHNSIIRKSVELLSTRKKRSYLLKSLQALFNTDEFLKAAMFGALGPNIFDYYPKRDKKTLYGSRVSFFLHDGGIHKLMSWMIERLYSYSDKNNEWASLQRAYLYGMISHIVTDTIFYPYIFYWSGFPDTYSREEINYYREQNLLFMYNMDNYYYNTYQQDYDLSIDSMLPVTREGKKLILNPSVKQFIIESMNEVYPEIFSEVVMKKFRKKDISENNLLDLKSHLDYIPFFIRLAYKLKRSNNKRVISTLRRMRSSKVLFSDFAVKYPDHRRVNDHVLNFHMEGWKYPAGVSGNRYDSVDKLFKSACEKTVEIWERIEACNWGKNDLDVLDEFKNNLYTGDEKKSYQDMKEKNPYKLSFRY